jgi:hypothetical protein
VLSDSRQDDTPIDSWRISLSLNALYRTSGSNSRPIRSGRRYAMVQMSVPCLASHLYRGRHKAYQDSKVSLVNDHTIFVALKSSSELSYSHLELNGHLVFCQTISLERVKLLRLIETGPPVQGYRDLCEASQIRGSSGSVHCTQRVFINLSSTHSGINDTKMASTVWCREIDQGRITKASSCEQMSSHTRHPS